MALGAILLIFISSSEVLNSHPKFPNTKRGRMWLPSYLVAASAALHLSHKFLKQSNLGDSTKRTICGFHAYLTEAMQLLLLAIAFVTCLNLQSPILYGGELVGIERPAPTWLALAAKITTYTLAIFAIDLFDNIIQLGRLTHPVQMQTLILTRSMLLPMSVKRKKVSGARRVFVAVRSPVRKRALSEPITPTMLSRPDAGLKRRDSTPLPGQVAKLIQTFEDSGDQEDLHQPEHNTIVGKEAEEVTPKSGRLITPGSLTSSLLLDLSPGALTFSTDSSEGVVLVGKAKAPLFSGATEAHNTKERLELRNEKIKSKEGKPAASGDGKGDVSNRLVQPKNKTMRIQVSHEGSPMVKLLGKKDSLQKRSAGEVNAGQMVARSE